MSFNHIRFQHVSASQGHVQAYVHQLKLPHCTISNILCCCISSFVLKFVCLGMNILCSVRVFSCCCVLIMFPSCVVPIGRPCIELYKSEPLSANIKLNLHKALTRPVMTYACPAWELGAGNKICKLGMISSVTPVLTKGTFLNNTLYVRYVHLTKGQAYS
jgi:hypothetical protein